MDTTIMDTTIVDKAPDSTRPPSLDETWLRRYRLEHVIGEGGMGVVYAVRDIETDELMALKVMRRSMLESTVGVARFMREARATRKLVSPHVTVVYDVGTFGDGVPYMVMECLHGSDLKVLLRQQTLPLGVAIGLILQACDAVAEAHGKGIIHRDLKPANLFITTGRDGASFLKVLDFGISKETNLSAFSLTTTGRMMGSPAYMSPEQWANAKAVDGRSDIWSLGVILYECVTGANPFWTGNVITSFRKVTEFPVVPPSTIRSDIPPEFDAVVMKCLEKDRRNRFSSVRELIQALGALVNPSANR